MLVIFVIDALRLHEIYRHRIIEELRVEIQKGWAGATSKRKVGDVVKDRYKVQSK